MKTFTINFNEIVGRFDPLYLINKSLIEEPNIKYSLVPIGHLLQKPIQYGANETAVYGDSNSDIRYIRITDIDEFGNLKYDDWRTAKIIKDRYILEENDILFARSGATAGKCFLYKKEYGKAIFGGYLIRFRFDENKVNPKFVFYYTQLKRYQLWVESIQRPSGQPNINSQEFKSFKIPLPEKKIQNEIIFLMENAYSFKKQKESQANQLLSSAYDYAVKELNLNYDIKIRKHFSISSTEIKNRIDPLYYTIPIYYFLKNCKYETKTIGEVTEYLKTGFAAGKVDQDLTGKGIIQIRPTNITEDKQFVFEKNVYIDKDKLAEKQADVLIKNEVLFNNTNSQEQVGKTLVFDLDGDYFCSNHITRIKVKDNEILPEFLALLLNVYQKQNIFFRICTNWNNQSGVNNTLLETLNISVPSIPEQERIVNEIQSRRNKAFELRKRAIARLEGAKAQVEKLLKNKRRN